MSNHPKYIHIDKDWLKDQYIVKKKSTNQIAKEMGIDVKTILRKIRKYGITKRTLSEQKSLDNLRIERWKGDSNPMKNPELKRKALVNRGSVAGKRNPMYGKKHSEETREKIRKKAEGRIHTEEHNAKIRKNTPSGKDSPHWQGGISPYPADWTKTLKTSIRQRDKFACQVCRKNGFDVHHIDYDRENCNPRNLITLCRSCHLRTNKNRDYWKEHFLNY